MTNPSAGGSYARQPDGSLKLVEETAQLGTEQHEGAAQPAPEVAPVDDNTKPRSRQKE
jgi:hypothetical protein